MIQITTHTPEQTHTLGRCLGRRIQKGVLIRLCGELGSGKTCFVQGLAQGLQVPEDVAVTSPTYTLINEYPGRLPLFHIDLYRLEGPADAETIGMWELIGEDAVVAVEWAERIDEQDWPPDHITVTFRLDEDDDTHLLRLNGYGLGMDDLIKQAVDSWKSNDR